MTGKSAVLVMRRNILSRSGTDGLHDSSLEGLDSNFQYAGAVNLVVQAGRVGDAKTPFGS